jgi:hypothetical protein
MGLLKRNGRPVHRGACLLGWRRKLTPPIGSWSSHGGPAAAHDRGGCQRQPGLHHDPLALGASAQLPVLKLCTWKGHGGRQHPLRPPRRKKGRGRGGRPGHRRRASDHGPPHGYDTEVGERGALLSAGERQLVAFARAWLADPALLILDEATSNLDVATETRVTEAMRRLRQGRTTIVIAHRLSTVIEADQIAVIQDGRVVEAGPPDQLLTRGGQFADLYGRWLAGAA